MGNTATSSPIEKKLQSQIEELLQRATKDALSGLLNRATMETHIINRIHKLQANEACAFFIIDLDWFKHVNDTFGHQAGDDESNLTAILFIENRPAELSGKIEKYDLDATAAKRIAELEHEFSVSQSDLRSTIQRLETVNGELQAANEELLTANEELQSSTEELQSVNEELYTVNTEHQLKLDELTMMTNDLSNFLSSTMIGILFVDSNLNIRKFTEYVGREFQLMEHDIGRSIKIFAHSFPDEAIEDDCHTVLRDLVSIDREVTAMNGRYYTLRIAPYRTTENSIRGLVITIIDSLGTSPEERKEESSPQQ